MKTWIISISAIVLLTSIFSVIIPESKVGKLIKSVFSVLVVFVIINPIINIKNQDFSFDYLVSSGDITFDDNYLDFISAKKVEVINSESKKMIENLGVKGVLISDLKYAGSDTQATSLVLATALKKINADLIFCGRQSVDGDTAQIPPMVAKRLGYDIVTNVIDFSGEDFFTRTT